jgi:PBSX family phage terminase large subunit
MVSVNLDISKLWIAKFDEVFQDVLEHKHTHYIFPGGRGSTKSSFIGGIIIPLLIISNPNCHAVCFRRYGNTLKTSIYAQVMWGIAELGLQEYFVTHVNPMEIIYKPTGQKILFLGMDDPGKVKSIKLPFGYIGITWWEELDQFEGEQQIRKAQQSTMRGGSIYWNFMSYNPPISMNNWANEYTEECERHRQKDTLVIRSTYLDVPRAWLGEQFIEEAEYLQQVNPRAYENEYMGIPVGTGGNVFENVEHMDMPDSMIASFDHIYNGLDWGFANDPNAYTKMHFDSARQDLYIFGEYRSKHETNKPLFEHLYEENHLKRRVYKIVDGQEVTEYIDVPFMETNELLTCDSAEQKSIADFRAWGAFARGAEKGPDSVRYGIKWLQGLRHIYIDKHRCPETYDEFVKYEYDRDKNGKLLSSYPDRDNHSIDSVRYALERHYKRKGN